MIITKNAKKQLFSSLWLVKNRQYGPKNLLKVWESTPLGGKYAKN